MSSRLIMRSLLCVSCLMSLSAAYITLEEAYGPVNETSVMIPPTRRHTLLGEEVDMCDHPLEIVILQDVSDSFQAHIDNMRDVQIHRMSRVLAKSHPGARIAVVSFRDKPLHPHGGAGDFCQEIECPLSNDATKVKETYSRLYSSGGGDGPENQFGAMVAAAQSASLGWSEGRATRLLVLATDSCPHFSDDGMNLNEMPPFSGTVNEGVAAEQCVGEYYPSPEQVKQSLEMRQVVVAQLIYDADDNNQLVRRCWDWFNDFIGQPKALLQPMAKDGSDFWEKLTQALNSVEGDNCQITDEIIAESERDPPPAHQDTHTHTETSTKSETLATMSSSHTVGMQFEAGLGYKMKLAL